MFFKKKIIKQDIPSDLRMELRALQEKINKEAQTPKIRYSLSPDPSKLKTAVKEIKETKLEPTFKELLFMYIDKSGITDPEVYKKAHINKRVFSKIRTGETKYVTKNTAICLALALNLELDDFIKLLKANGDNLGDNTYFDIAIKWCIKNNIYDVEQVNDILYACDLQLLTK